MLGKRLQNNMNENKDEDAIANSCGEKEFWIVPRCGKDDDRR